ncbi:hypothetical protein EYF80_028547 [Liparis tanakae]|uniref:Uncharacterized protein n=1 Tax=Liparis tanakae TaxID=230148 RepID=A0A4Z2H908_9TELE|nr:hypothetical protein EYF80_028547 [Liparis tanakae]
MLVVYKMSVCSYSSTGAGPRVPSPPFREVTVEVTVEHGEHLAVRYGTGAIFPDVVQSCCRPGGVRLLWFALRGSSTGRRCRHPPLKRIQRGVIARNRQRGTLGARECFLGAVCSDISSLILGVPLDPIPSRFWLLLLFLFLLAEKRHCGCRSPGRDRVFFLGDPKAARVPFGPHPSVEGLQQLLIEYKHHNNTTT